MEKSIEARHSTNYINYNEMLDTLFEQWNCNKEEKFCKDGLMELPGKNVNQLWEKSPRRIMFIAKEKNRYEGDDIRKWLILDSPQGEENRNLFKGNVGKIGFLPNIAKMLYGLTITKKSFRPNYWQLKGLEAKIKEMFSSTPFALVEAKKIAGGPICNNTKLNESLNNDESFLKKEIDILQPNIIVCLDPKDNIFNFITEKYFTQEEPHQVFGGYYEGMNIHTCLWYYKNRKSVVIKSYHPTNLGKREGVIYEKVLSPFGGFMNAIDPDWL